MVYMIYTVHNLMERQHIKCDGFIDLSEIFNLPVANVLIHGQIFNPINKNNNKTHTQQKTTSAEIGKKKTSNNKAKFCNLVLCAHNNPGQTKKNGR